MFPGSTTLISQYFTSYLKQTVLDSSDNIYFDLSYVFQESMILSQLQLTYLYCLQLSLTSLQNYGITAFMNFWFSPLKHQKLENEQQQNRSLKKHHRLFTSLLNYVSYVPLRLKRFCAFRAFAPYVPLHLTCLDFYAP